MPSPGLIDSLPPFSILTTDEERERKAEVSSPGTYHVVVNPNSFSGLPEYFDRFEDTSHRSLSNQWKNSGFSPSISSEMTNASSPSDAVHQFTQEFPFEYDPTRPLDRVVLAGGADETLLSHFRGVVWKQLIQGQSIRDVSTPLSSPVLPGAEVFEEVAMTFRPVSPKIIPLIAVIVH
jgi:hypothetical protein